MKIQTLNSEMSSQMKDYFEALADSERYFEQRFQALFCIPIMKQDRPEPVTITVTPNK
jgi:hypothetical protein